MKKRWAVVLYCGWALMVPLNEKQMGQRATTWSHIGGSFDSARECQDSARDMWQRKVDEKNKSLWAAATCVPIDIVYGTSHEPENRR